MAEEPKTALITGAASGLGRAVTLRLAERGWHIAVADTNHVGGEETVSMASSAGGHAHFEPLDVCDRQQWVGLRDRLAARWDQLDLLMNNAGVCGAGEVDDYPYEDWRWMLEVNLFGVINGCHTMIPWLKHNTRGAHVINTASIAGIVSAGTMGSYNVSKAGVLALTETLYAELRPHGVGVTVLCPGFFRSGLFDTARWSNDRSEYFGQYMMDRAGATADRVAELAIRAMDRKRLYVVHPWRARVSWRIKRWFPRTFHRLVAAGYRKMIYDRAEKESADQSQAATSQAAVHEASEASKQEASEASKQEIIS